MVNFNSFLYQDTEKNAIGVKLNHHIHIRLNGKSSTLHPLTTMIDCDWLPLMGLDRMH